MLELLQRQALAVELAQAYLPIKLVRAEDEVPLLEWPTLWTLSSRLHMLRIYLGGYGLNLFVI